MKAEGHPEYHMITVKMTDGTEFQTRSDPDKFGLNAATLDGVSPYDFAEVAVFDGVNHPRDTGISRYAGTMRYEPAED